MQVGSLFSGIGGFDLGLERAGFHISWQVEIDDYCRRVLRKHWPSVPCHADIRAIDWPDIPAVDLVCGGFPCQPFSLAGKRRGAEDDRYLWPEVVRCLAILKPAWGCFENVPGLINMGLDQVLFDLESLGYETGTLCIPACAVDAPHIRQRIWILAYHAGEQAGISRQPRVYGRVGKVSLADAEGLRREQRHTNGRGRSQGTVETKERPGSPHGDRWPSPPDVCRVDVRVPDWAHRIKGIGNSLVPQVAEELGRMIMECHRPRADAGEGAG